VKIVQISDLHRTNPARDEVIRKAVRLANAESADIVVLTGDFVNTTADNAAPCADMLSHLKARWGVFAVLGNHDNWHGPRQVERALRVHNIRVLNNENSEVAPGLFIIGIDDEWTGHPDVKRAWSGVDEGAGQILLSHTPLAISLFKNKRCLALTGHTHGGQVVLPFVSRNRLPGLRGCPYISGWYRERNVQMYVNRGIGMVNPAIRFRCRPEISVFRLRASPHHERPR
jgi:hypothetical protein